MCSRAEAQNESIALPATPTDWPTNTEFLAARTHAHLKAHEAAKTYFWANRWIEADPKSVEAHLIRAETLMALQAPAAAIEACDTGLALDPPTGFRLFRLLTLRANALNSVGEAEAAWNDIRSARAVAADMGAEAKPLLRDAEKLQWRLLARMQSGPAHVLMARREKPQGGVPTPVQLISRTQEARAMIAQGKAAPARTLLSEIIKHPTAPPDAAYLLWTLQYGTTDIKTVAATVKRAVQLGYGEALMSKDVYGDSAQFAPHPLPVLKFETSETELSPAWYEWVLASYAAYSKQHPESARTRKFGKEFAALRARMKAFPQRVETLRLAPVTETVWRATVTEAAGFFQALGQMRSDADVLNENTGRLLEVLSEANYALTKSKKAAHQPWAKQIGALMVKTQALVKMQAQEKPSLLKEMNDAAFESQTKDADGINLALSRLWQKRVADDIIAKTASSNAPVAVIKATDELMQVDGMTPDLWVRRAQASRQTGSIPEALLAAAQALSADTTTGAAGESVRRWMDETLAQADAAPEKAAREKAANHLDEALLILQSAVQINRANARVHLALSETYASLGEMELARTHAEGAWRCHLTDSLEVRRVLGVALQVSHWRLAHVASEQLLRTSPLDAQLRYSHALGAAGMGDQDGAYDEFRVIEAIEGLDAPVTLEQCLTIAAGNKEARTIAFSDLELDKPEVTPGLRFWAAIQNHLAGKPLPSNLIRGADPEQRPRLERLTGFLEGTLSTEDYRAQSQSHGEAGFADFAAGFRRSFVERDEMAKKQLLSAASDASLPALWRAMALLRARVAFDISSDGPLTAREAVLIPADAKTVAGAIERALPGQRIEIRGSNAQSYDLPPTLSTGLRIRSAGALSVLNLPSNSRYLSESPRLIEFEGVELSSPLNAALDTANHVVSLQHCNVQSALRMVSGVGALEVSHSSLDEMQLSLPPSSLSVFSNSTTFVPIVVGGEMLLHRSAFGYLINASGKEARVVGRDTRHAPRQYLQGGTSLRATDGAKIQLANSLVCLDKEGVLESEGQGSLIEVERLVTVGDPKIALAQKNAGQVRVAQPILTLYAPNPTAHDVSTADELTQALARVRPGDVINLAKGDYLGSFDVPAGVSLLGVNGTRLISDIDLHPYTVRVRGEGVTRLHNLDITLKSQWDSARDKEGRAGEEGSSALDVATGGVALLSGLRLSSSSENPIYRREKVRSLRVGKAVSVGQTVQLYGNVAIESGGWGWMNGSHVGFAELRGGGSLFSSAASKTERVAVSGSGTTFIGRSGAALYRSGAHDPRLALDATTPAMLQIALWKAAREQLDTDMRNSPNENERFDALLKYDRKIHRVGDFANVSSDDGARHFWSEVRPFVTNGDLAARVLLRMRGDGSTVKSLLLTLDYPMQEHVRKYMKTVVDMYANQVEGGHERVVARMALWNAYPPGTINHEAAMLASKAGQTLAQFNVALAAQESARAQAARRAAELAKAELAKFLAANRAALSAQRAAPSSRGSYTPTWDGSFSSQAMSNWETTNKAVQASQQRYYEREFRQGNRNVPW